MGGMNLGKTANSTEVALQFPFQAYVFDLMGLHKMYVVLSIIQSLAASLFPKLFSNGNISNAITAGWSLGALFAFYSSFTLEACFTGPRAVLAIDARGLPPLLHVPPMSKLRAANQIHWSLEDLSQRGTQQRVSLRFATVPKWRFCVPTFHFRGLLDSIRFANDRA